MLHNLLADQSTILKTVCSPAAVLRGLLYTCVFLVPLVWDPQGYYRFEPSKWSTLLILTCAMLPLLLAGTRVKRPTLGTLLAGMCIAVLIITTVMAVNPAISFWGTASRQAGLLSLLSLPILYFSIRTAIETDQQRTTLLRMLALGSISPCLIALVKRALLHQQATDGELVYRVLGSLGNPLYLAGYLVMVIPITGYLIGHAWPLQKKWAITSVLLLIAQLVTLHFTQARTAQATLVLGIAAGIGLLILRRRKPKEIIACSVLAVIAFAVAFKPLTQKLEQISRDASMQSRLQLWQEIGTQRQQYADSAYAEMNRDARANLRAWLGWGPDSMGQLLGPWQPPEAGLANAKLRYFDRSHNQNLDLLLAHGWPGLILYNFCFIAAALFLLRHHRQGGWTLAVLMTLGIHYLEQQMMFLTAGTAMLLALFFGLCHTANRPPNRRDIPIALVGVVVSVAMAAAITLSIRPFLANRHAQQGLTKRNQGLHSDAVKAFLLAQVRTTHHAEWLKELGLSLNEQALRDKDPVRRNKLLEGTIGYHALAMAVDPLHADHLVNRARAKILLQSERSEFRADYQRATELKRHEVHLYKEWATAELFVHKSIAPVIEQLDRYGDDPNYRYWFEIVATEVLLLQSSPEHLSDARMRLDHARATIPETRPVIALHAQLVDADLCAAEGNLPAAITHCEAIIAQQVARETAWKAHLKVAGLYARNQQPEKAKAAADQALKVVPTPARAALKRQLDGILN